MSLLVVVVVAALVFFYVRATRRARLAWLQKLALPGRWLAEVPEASATAGADPVEELILKGEISGGDYIWLREDQSQQRGEWRVSGNNLELCRDGDASEMLDLHLFKPGQIGLEDKAGHRRIFH
ncbi:MAG: hypothetical protein AAF993_11585, partial [Pseudomonadota bacterium]